MQNRNLDLMRFYQLLEKLEQKIGKKLFLFSCDSRSKFPAKGVYFFIGPNETRTNTGSGLRVVRVGTHGLKLGAKSTLWQRLSQHKGATSGGGNHRGSIFRLLIGTTFAGRIECSTWGQGKTAEREIRLQEVFLEKQVSEAICKMPFLYLEVSDEASPDSLRGMIERNSIALLSNYQKAPIDPPSPQWRGHHCDREKVRMSGLWNQRHVEESYAPEFLQIFDCLIERMGPNL